MLRERILGVRHPETFYYLRYRGAVYADAGLFDRSYHMWAYALELQQRCLLPLNVMTLISIRYQIKSIGSHQIRSIESPAARSSRCSR